MALAAILVCCTPERPSAPGWGGPTTRSFYYWRTTLTLGAAELQALRALRVERLYLRLFDVTWDEPTGVTRAGELSLSGSSPIPAGLTIVPVVFLRQEVLRHLDAAGVRGLAAMLDERFASHQRALGFQAPELQLDCDWTDRTQRTFFLLLEELRRLTKARAGAGPAPLLSATIRLHQIKYRERTGVPPVDRGMLMFYNMGHFSALPQDRAIFDAARAEPYLARLPQYPLPLDVALPLWAWTLQLRDGEVVGLLQSTDPEELADVAFLRRTGQDRYVATETAFFRGALLRAGDELKGERLSGEELLAAAAQLARHLRAGARAIALFDLSERNLGRYEGSLLDRLFVRSVR